MRCPFLFALAIGTVLAVAEGAAAQPVLSRTAVFEHEVSFMERPSPRDETRPARVELYISVSRGDSSDVRVAGVRLLTMESAVSTLWNRFDTLGNVGLDTVPLVVTFETPSTAPAYVRFFWPALPEWYPLGWYERERRVVEAIVLEALERHRFSPPAAQWERPTGEKPWRLEVSAYEAPPSPIH